jgi:hypothetical protein
MIRGLTGVETQLEAGGVGKATAVKLDRLLRAKKGIPK